MAQNVSKHKLIKNAGKTKTKLVNPLKNVNTSQPKITPDKKGEMIVKRNPFQK